MSNAYTSTSQAQANSFPKGQDFDPLVFFYYIYHERFLITESTDVRCHMEDAKLAVKTGVDGLDLVIGTSSLLREFSHGKDMTQITASAIEVINYVKSQGLEVRFSSEDSFRSNLVDLLSLYRAVNDVGVDRVGVADTVGCASPRQVYDLIRTLRGVVKCDIETHFHNDTGCAIANAYVALEAGATRTLCCPNVSAVPY